MKMFRRINIILFFLAVLFAGINSFPWVRAQETAKEITVIGSAMVGKDPDRMYMEALEVAFNKAYLTLNKTGNLSAPNQGTQDPISIQKKLGVDDYRILRYWQDDGIFNMEIKIIFGDVKNDLSQEKNLSEPPKANWNYQASGPVISVREGNLSLAVNTERTIDLVGLVSGKPVKRIKTGSGDHDVLREKYIIKEKDYLKASNFTKVNLLNMGFVWRQKFPDLHKFFLAENAIYIYEKNGFLKAVHWEDGSIKWKIAALGLEKIKPVASDRFLYTFASPELWLVNSDGGKIWTRELDAALGAEPVVRGNEIYCVLQNSMLVILDLPSGSKVSAWNLQTRGTMQNALLEVGERQVFLSFNDREHHGHLQTYQRYTGSLQWEVTWYGTVTALALSGKDFLTVGMDNVIEAREILFGLKAWNLPVNRKITKLYFVEEKLIVAAENKIYSYDIK